MTSSIPEVERLKKEFPVLRHKDASFYIRKERGGLIVGPYEDAEKMKIGEDWVRNGVPSSNSNLSVVYLFYFYYVFLNHLITA